jgi:hypothetical protein
MSIRLYVDDIRKEPEGWVRAKTVTEAIRILDEQDVVEVSLDHDISMKVSVGYGDSRPFASPETYEPVARFIRQMALAHLNGGGSFNINKVTLHTANAVGAEKMKAILAPVSQIIKVEVSLSKPCNRFEDED